MATMEVTRGRRTGRMIAGGVTLALTAAVGWAVATPGASAAEVTIGAEMTYHQTTTGTGRHTAVADTAQWYVAVSTDRLSVSDKDGNQLGADSNGTSWVALNHGADGRPLDQRSDGSPWMPGSGGTPQQRYLVDVRPGRPVATYGVQWVSANHLLNRPSGTTTIGTADGNWRVQARKINLVAGDKVRMSLKGGAVSSVAILFNNPDNRAGAVRNYESADYTFWTEKFAQPNDTATYAFTAPKTTEYAVIFNRNDNWTDEKTASFTTTITR